MTRQQMLDVYFMEARSRLIELAAFLDRVDRAPGEVDFRWNSIREAMKELGGGEGGRTERVLLALSDPTVEPVLRAPGKGAVGAWAGSGEAR